MIDLTLVPVTEVPIEDVKDYPRNNKIHSDESVAKLAKSIKTSGLAEPIIVDKDMVIISGHGRKRALESLGWKTAPVRVLDTLTDTEADALRIAVNKTANQHYDTEMLQQELSRLSLEDVDLTSLGFDDRELEVLVTDVGEINLDGMASDLDEAVDEHSKNTSDRADEIGAKEIPISKALGFKSVRVDEQITLRDFMAQIETSTGKKGGAALVAFARDMTSA